MFLHKKKLRKQVEVTLKKKRVNLLSSTRRNPNKEVMFLHKKKLKRGIEATLKKKGVN